jgi:hypothetical protein
MLLPQLRLLAFHILGIWSTIHGEKETPAIEVVGGTFESKSTAN